MLENYKLAVFDLDGTLTEGDPSWVMLHKKFNTMQIGEEGERLYSQGLITYREFILRDLSAWPRPLRKAELQEALASYRLREDADLVVKFFKKRGVKIALLTAALDIMAEEVAGKLGVDYVMSNSLGFNDLGIFDGRIYAKVEPKQKHRLLDEICKQIKIDTKETIAVGDSIYDVSFLKASGKGFLINNRELAVKYGLIPIDRLGQIIQIIDGHEPARFRQD